jgi:hypothetical protein
LTSRPAMVLTTRLDRAPAPANTIRVTPMGGRGAVGGTDRYSLLRNRDPDSGIENVVGDHM